MNEERLLKTFVACAVMCVRIHGFGKAGRDDLRSYFTSKEWRTVIRAVARHQRIDPWWVYRRLNYCLSTEDTRTWTDWTRALLAENPEP
jgi:hypothetical protein